MSYCRWSTDDFQCDLYVYEDVYGGWTIHVAGNRPIFTESLPEPISLDEEHAEAWLARHKLVMEMVENAKREPIDLPHVGETFHESTAYAAADRVAALRNLGYRCPPDVELVLREEAC